MRLSNHVHHFALVISIYDLVIFIDVRCKRNVLVRWFRYSSQGKPFVHKQAIVSILKGPRNVPHKRPTPPAFKRPVVFEGTTTPLKVTSSSGLYCTPCALSPKSWTRPSTTTTYRASSETSLPSECTKMSHRWLFPGFNVRPTRSEWTKLAGRVLLKFRRYKSSLGWGKPEDSTRAK